MVEITNGKLKFLEFIHYTLMVLIALSMPFSIKINNAISIFLITNSVFYFVKAGGRFNEIEKTNKRMMFLFSFLCLPHFLAFLFSADFSTWTFVERKISIFIFPFAIGIGPTLKKEQLLIVLAAFVFSVFTAALIPLWNRWDLLIPDGIELTWRLTIHRPYFGLYALFSFLLVLYLARYTRSMVLKIVIVLLGVFLVYFSFLIYAKMAILSISITIILTVLVVLTLGRNFKQLAVTVISLIFLVAIFLFLNPSFREVASRVLTFKYFDSNYNQWFFSSLNIRYVIWDCTIEFVKGNWLFGAGLDNQLALDACNNSKWLNYGLDPNLGQDPLTHLINNSYNAHNDILQFWLDTGVFGFLVILMVLSISVVYAVRKNNVLYFAFLVFFILCGLTEALLMRQKGIVFYSFFNSLLFFSKTK